MSGPAPPSLAEAFAVQGAACASLGSPFMGRLMPLCAARLRPGTAVADRLLTWPGDVGPSAQSLPLRLAGTLHALVLDGTAPGLAAAYPPNRVDDDTLWAAIERAFAEHEARIMRWLDSPPQTNEVRRSAALIPAALIVADRFGLPLVLSELGASAGLNLGFDRFALILEETIFGPRTSPVTLRPNWSGPLPRAARLEIRGRAGVDLNPLDPGRAADALRIMAYLWPDQPDRLNLTRGAMALAKIRPDRGDAARWLERRLQTRHRGAAHVVFHTIAWQYFPDDTQRRCEAALERAGAGARADAPLARIAMEADATPGSAALTLQTWPGDGPAELARVDFHGRWIDWHATSLAR